mmetsp:Transcript_24199/g.58461  ORF Transcript_24199/g.58461 Transcript_24199/m.58461 type:complete len:224 (-) Transcript_24199:639-1310(-)
MLLGVELLLLFLVRTLVRDLVFRFQVNFEAFFLPELREDFALTSVKFALFVIFGLNAGADFGLMLLPYESLACFTLFGKGRVFELFFSLLEERADRGEALALWLLGLLLFVVGLNRTAFIRGEAFPLSSFLSSWRRLYSFIAFASRCRSFTRRSFSFCSFFARFIFRCISSGESALANRGESWVNLNPFGFAEFEELILCLAIVYSLSFFCLATLSLRRRSSF